jgi:hypothetical protein
MDEPRHNLAPAGQMKQQPIISQVCEWVKTSLESVKQEITVKSFKKCGISNALDRTEDDVLLEENESLNNNSESGSSNEDFRGFCDQ